MHDSNAHLHQWKINIATMVAPKSGMAEENELGERRAKWWKLQFVKRRLFFYGKLAYTLNFHQNLSRIMQHAIIVLSTMEKESNEAEVHVAVKVHPLETHWRKIGAEQREVKNRYTKYYKDKWNNKWFNDV